MPNATVPVCAEPGCEKKVLAKGLCATHYHHEWDKIHRPSMPVEAQVKNRPCNVPDCANSGYTQWPGRSDDVLCRHHYDMLRRRGTTDAAQLKPEQECAAPNCARKARSKAEGSLCENCYHKKRRHDRGLKKVGPKPNPSLPRSRHASARAGEGTQNGVPGKPVKDWDSITHCTHGHLLTEENLIFFRRGNRVEKHCRRCNRDHQIRTLYDLEPEEWDAMLIAQSGRCYICEDPMLKPFVDHNHITNKVRKLLCKPCNDFIHREDPDLLRAGAAYLEEHAA